MSSNIGPEAKKKYAEYLDAQTLEEKITKLREFISAIPKHKATEKIVALNKTRLVKLKKELEKQTQRKKSLSSQVSPFSVKSEGIQVILISDHHLPGVGKTTILHHLTGAKKEQIGKFTATPQIGIYNYDQIKFQIVDMPPLMKDAAKGVGHGLEMLSTIRTADLVCFCVDLSRNIEEQIDLFLNEFYNANIRINQEAPPIEIEKTGSNRIQVLFMSNESKKSQEIKEDIIDLVQESGMQNGIVRIYGDITIDDLIDAMNPSIAYVKVLIIATKGDQSHTKKQFKLLKEKYSNTFPVINGTSAVKEKGFDKFGQVLLDFLRKIKIFTKSGTSIADKPLIMDKYSTVKDVTLKIHKNFYEYFKYAIIYREKGRMQKKRVGLDYYIKNNDVIEIFTTL